jgi:U3 small nucleolar RNA-associated protein 20
MMPSWKSDGRGLLILTVILVTHIGKLLQFNYEGKPFAEFPVLVSFVAFGLELLHTALKRSKFDFHDPAVLVRLETMVAVVGNTLYHNAAPVLVLGMKTAAAIIKCPLKSLDKSAPAFVQKIIDIVRHIGSMDSDVVQVALKSLATILRDCPKAEAKEKDLVYLLELLLPDLEEPDRQAAVFAMLRAILSRKFVVPEIYDTMDKVYEIMVTNQAPHVRELCRLAILQFLLDYPQGKGRLRKSMTFLAKNLSYVHESGRASVMELLGAVVAKFEAGLISEYADLLFVALVMVLANDDSAKCREMAAAVIKALLARLDAEQRKVTMSRLHSWALASQPLLKAVSSHVYGLFVDLLQADASPYLPVILEDVNAIIISSAQACSALSGTEDDNEQMDWQAPYHALTTLSKVLRVMPDYSNQEGKIRWQDVAAHLLYPHAWVRVASCRLVGVLFSAVTPASPDSLLPNDSLVSAHGLRELAGKLCMQLKSEHLDAAHSLQVVKNLLYVGKCFYAMPVPTAARIPEVQADGDEEADTGGSDQHPLPWLFSKLSYQARSAQIARRNRTASNVSVSGRACH